MNDKIVQDLRVQSWSKIRTHITAADLKAFYSAWNVFFLSESKYVFHPGPKFEGYFPYKSERAGRSDVADPKEFFHFYEWSSCPAHCEKITTDVWCALKDSALEVLEAIKKCCGVNLCADFSSSARKMLRVTHYTPHPSSPIFAAPHTDINLLSLLPRPTGGGLEIFDRQCESWRPLPEIADGWAIVLVGDMLAEASSGEFVPALHRVSCSGSERTSLSFFANPPDEVRLSARCTAGELLSKRSGRISAN